MSHLGRLGGAASHGTTGITSAMNSNRCDLHTAGGTPFNHHASTHTFAPSMREGPAFLVGSPESRLGTALSNQRSYNYMPGNASVQPSIQL